MSDEEFAAAAAAVEDDGGGEDDLHMVADVLLCSLNLFLCVFIVCFDRADVNCSWWHSCVQWSGFTVRCVSVKRVCFES